MQDTFLLFVFILVCLGILRDVIMAIKFFDSWLARKQNGDPKQPASLEVLNVLLSEHSENTVNQMKLSFDLHFAPLLEEYKRTNEKLTKFLIGQQIIAKRVHGVDIDV